MTYYNSLDRLINILNELREKCPWDKKQTIHSLRSNTIEELYELMDGIQEENWENIKEELGDILLHILFYSKLADEQNHFNINDVIENVSNKLVRRHPHIYENVQLDDADAVKKNWEKLKLKEGKKSVLSGVPKALPAITKAFRLQDKAKQVGFEWDNKEAVWEKVEEELNEFKAAQTLADKEEEFGDVLFSLINYARFEQIDPEKALEITNHKFKTRFEYIEEQCNIKGLDINTLSLEEMDQFWNEAKQLKHK